MGLPHCCYTGDSSSAPRMHLIDATARYTMGGRALGKDLKSLITGLGDEVASRGAFHLVSH